MLQKPEHKLQPKLSTILKQELINVPQTYGTFSDGNGKYCVLAAVAKYLGYDVESGKGKSTVLAPELSIIPMTIIERSDELFTFRYNDKSVVELEFKRR